MPLYQLAVIAAAACVVFLRLRKKWGKDFRWKLLMLAGFAASICLIVFQTFWNRESSGVQLAPLLTPFHTYRAYLAEPFEEILRMNFMNTILFLPAGMFLCELMPRRWNRWISVVLSVLLLGALSGGIEYVQFVRALGQAEIDDVIHNILGALLGALIVALSSVPTDRESDCE